MTNSFAYSTEEIQKAEKDIRRMVLTMNYRTHHSIDSAVIIDAVKSLQKEER